MLRFIVADDHPVVVRGIREIITENFDNVTIDESGRGHDVIRMVGENDYDLVILDISLPDLNGMDVLKEIRKIKSKLPVLVIGTYPEEQYVVRVVKAGGRGYLTKRSDADELVLAVNKILSGKRYISPAFAEKMMFDFDFKGSAFRNTTGNSFICFDRS